jgi:hypothetical protein
MREARRPSMRPTTSSRARRCYMETGTSRQQLIIERLDRVRERS